MVAVISGSNLGLFNTSLGQFGAAPGSGVDPGRDHHHVNVATGNLVLQTLDESLLVRGLSANYLRTYNSRGNLEGWGQGGWTTGFERKLRQFGTLNAPGSTIWIESGDGDHQIFYWVATDTYRSTDGEGAHDTVVWNATAANWTYTEGSSRRQETYADLATGSLPGKLLSISEGKSDGGTPARFDLIYDAQGRVQEVRSVDGAAPGGNDALLFGYGADGRIATVSTRENGVLRSQLAYEYDAAGRLISVTTDLTPTIATDNVWDPNNPAANNGLRFRTTYSYLNKAANDHRIASMTTGDGVRYSYTYEDSGDGSSRVRTVTRGDAFDGSQQTTSFSYKTVGQTDIKDSAGNTWTYRFDGEQRLTSVDEPAVGGQRARTEYFYDGYDNLVRSRRLDGNSGTGYVDTVYRYDGNGNRILERDRLGNTVAWTYSADNLLLSETRYTIADADGLDPDHVGNANLPSGALTTRYAYDARGRLRFVIDAAGGVRELTYATSGNGIGQLSGDRRYVGDAYAGTGWSEGELAAWATAARRASSQLSTYGYDAKGRMQQLVQYATLDSAGNGVLDAATAITNFVYDAQGLMRQQVTVQGAGRSLAGAPPAPSRVTDFMYDGLGRLLSTIARDAATGPAPDPITNPASYQAWLLANDATTIVTSYAYLDASCQIRVVADAGLTRVEVRNYAGVLLSSSESGVVAGSTVNRTSRNHYDAAGRLRASEDAAGARTYYFYDANGRLVATVDGTGLATEIRYDAVGRILREVRYARPVSTTSWFSGGAVTIDRLVFSATVPMPMVGQAWVQTDPANDRHEQRSYDAAGRLQTTTDALGLVTTHVYDAASRLVATTQSNPTVAGTTPRTTRQFHDAAGRVRGTLDAAGYLVELVYDAGGRLAKTIRYANVTNSGWWATGTIDQLRPATNAGDQVTRHFHDGRGQPVGTLDAEGYLVEMVVDEAGNQRATRAYGKKLTGLAGTESLATLRALATTSLPPNTILVRETRRTFDALGRPSVEVDHEGTVTRWKYDDAGRLVATERGNLASEIRADSRRYDVFGNLVGELGGEGSTRLLPGMSEAQIDAIYAQYGVRHGYDVLGRRIESVDAAGNKTWYFHDAAGRQTFVVRGVANAQGVANAEGEVVESRYNAFGEVTEAIAYTGRIVVVVPGSRDSVRTAVSALAVNAAVDSRSEFRYDQRGNVRELFDPRGFRTQNTYTGFGELWQQIRYEANGSTVFATRTHTWNSRGLLTDAVEAGGALSRAQHMDHDAFGRVAMRQDARGAWTRLEYDRLGRQVVQTALAVGGRDETVRIDYDAFAQVVATRDANNQATTYRYDDANRTVTVTTPEGVAVTTGHDRFGQTVLVSQVLPDGSTATSRVDYDRDGRARFRTNELGNVDQQQYDARGLMYRATDASGRIVDYTYDAAGRVITRIEDVGGLNLTTRYVYDGQGRQVRVTDPSGRVVRMEYDQAGNLAATVRDPDGLALRTTYAWDRDGRQLNVIEAAGTAAQRTTTYEYDKLGRRTKEIQADGVLALTTHYAYDLNDNVVRSTDASGRAVRYAYDAANRLRWRVDDVGGTVEQAWDAAGRMTMSRSYARKLNLAAVPAQPTESDLATAIVNQGLADDVRDEAIYRIHDRDGRVAMTIDGTGGVTLSAYDSAGRRTTERSHAAPIVLSSALRAQLRAGTATTASVQLFPSANDQRVRTVHDAAGQAVFAVDAAGGVVRSWYDAAGRVVAQARYATGVDPAAIGDATTVAQLAAMLVPGAADQVEYYVYDAAGRLRYTTNSFGQLTQLGYDGAGRETTRRIFAQPMLLPMPLRDRLLAGTAGEADFATFAASFEAGARSDYRVYDLAGRLRYTVSRSAAGLGQVAELRYDAADRVVAEVAYGGTVAFNPAHTVAQLDSAVAGLAQRTTRHAYDAAGRLRFSLDATGALVEQRYDGAGRVIDSLAYAQRPPAGTTSEAGLATWATTQPLAQVRRTSSFYDAAGRLQSRTDANSVAESYTYDGIGRELTRTDRNAKVWTREYDAAGRTTAEFSPAVAVTSVTAQGAVTTTSRQVVTRYGYDAIGNLTSRRDDADAPVVAERRLTQFDYDSRGHQVRVTFPAAGRIDHATGALIDDGVTVYTEVRYNLLGQAVVQRDVRGFHSYRAYDALGRVAYEIDQERNATSYSYNSFGEQSELRRHFTAFDPATVPGWYEGRELTAADISGRLQFSASDRAISSGYDALGRRTALVSSSVAYYRANGNVATGTPTTAFVYDAYGDLVRESVLREGTAGQADAVWAHTTRYYDAEGRNTLTVDAENYVTRTQYYATGEASETIEYARALAQHPDPASVPGLPAAGDAATGFDRKVSWTYDALGRKKTETAARYYQRVDGSTGVRDVLATFNYDGEGRATSVIDETGTTTTRYDALGRVESVQEAARQVLVGNIDGVLGSTARDLTSTQAYESRSPYTTFAYDAYGNTVQVRRYANGRNGSLAAVADDARDQVQSARYDRQGRAVWERDALGNVTTREFDAADHVTETRWKLDGNEGRSAAVTVYSNYDDTGRLLGNTTRRERFEWGTSVGFTTDIAEAVTYNAFGEIVRKDHAFMADALVYGYDAAGRMTSSNDTGAVRNYGYDLSGARVREWHAAYLGGTQGSVTATTVSRVDRLGREVEVTLPAHSDAMATSSLNRRLDRWGNVLQVIDTRGYQTDYEYDTFNNVVRETRPLVLVVGEDGGESWQRPVNRWYYDALGRLVASRDANGNLRTNDYDLTGRLVAVRDALGNVTRHGYDALGNQRISQDPLGALTFRDFDRLGRNTAIGDFAVDVGGLTRTKKALQSFVLDQAGNRRVVTDANNLSAYYDYDSRQLLLRSRGTDGVVADYAYDVLGRRTRDTGPVPGTTFADRENEQVRTGEQTWDFDVFGRAIDSNNLSGRDGNYVYDAASGRQVSENFAGGLGIVAGTATKTYSYYANGLVRQIVETGGGTYRYEYDAAGNRTVEESWTTDAYGQTVRMLTRTTYDSNNRIQRVVQDDLTANKRVFDLITDYDANGNRRRVRAASGYGPNVDGIGIANTAPIVIRQVEDRTVRKGFTAQFRLLFTDIFRDLEQDALSVAIAQNNGNPLPSWLIVTRDADTGELVFDATPGTFLADQDIVVRLTASETANPGNAAVETFVVRVRSNTPPALIDPAAVALQAKTNQPWNRDFVAGDFFRDDDVGDSLALSFDGALPSWLQADFSTPGVVRVSGTPSVATTYTLWLRATDQMGQSVVKQFTITTAPNRPPTLVATPAPTDAIIGRDFNWMQPLSAVFTDLDGDPLQVGAKLSTGAALPAWMSFQYLNDQAVPELRFVGNVPTTEVNGNVYSVVLTARDTDGAVTTTTLTVRVFNNRAPVATAGTTAIQAVRVNDNFSRTLPLSALFVDPEGDPLAIVPVFPAGSFLSTWLKVTVNHAAGTVTFAKVPGSTAPVGNFTFELRATDVDGLPATKTLSLAVGADTAPVRNPAVSLPDRALNFNRTFSFALPAGMFTDADGDPVTLSVQRAERIYDFELQRFYVEYQPLPSWMTYNAATGTLSGVVPASHPPMYLRIIATDSRGLESAQDMVNLGPDGYQGDADLRVSFSAWTNTPPQPNATIPGRTIVHGGAVDFALPANAFVEPDGDTMTYSGEVQIGANWVSMSQIGLLVDAATGRITGSPYNLTQASFNARIVARDPQQAPGYGNFVFTVTNTPPTVGTIPNVTVGSNANINVPLAGYFSDVNANALTFSVSALPNGVTFNTTTGVLGGRYQGVLTNWSVTITANDGRGGSIGTSFFLSVTNTAPTPPSPPVGDQTVVAGSAMNFTVPAFTDANGDALTYTAAGLPSWLQFDVNTRRLYGTAGPVGNWPVTITARDPHGGTASITFAVKTPSTPPTYNGGIGNQTAQPGQFFDWSFAAGTFTDPNGDALTYTADLANGTALPAWLQFDAANRRFYGTPTAVASYLVRVNVSDGTNLVQRTFTITVPNVGPQAGTALPNRAAARNESVFWTLPAGAFTDPNGDAFSYVLMVERPEYYTIDYSNPFEPRDVYHPPTWLPASSAGLSIAANGTITGGLQPLFTTHEEFNFRAKIVATAGGNSVESLFAINVRVPPQAPAVGPQTLDQGAFWQFTVPAFTDGNYDTLSYSIGGLPAGLQFDASPNARRIYGTPTGYGTFPVTVTASDGTSTASVTFNLVVRQNSAPNPPANVGNLNGTVGQAFNAGLPEFTDPNWTDTLTYSVSALPPGLTFNATTRVISGTPTGTDSRTVTYTCSDGRGGTASVDFTITIGTGGGNGQPYVLDGLEDKFARTGVHFSYTFPATAFADPDGNVLTYTAARTNGAWPTWLTFNATTRTFYGTPTGNQVQIFAIRVTARDPGGLTATCDFTIEKEGNMLVASPVEGGEVGIEQPIGIEPPVDEEQAGLYSFDMGKEGEEPAIDDVSEEVVIDDPATQPVILPVIDDPEGGKGEDPVKLPPVPAAVPVQRKDQWFTYDAENRLQINGGTLSGIAGAAGTTIVLGGPGSDSYTLTYDAVGHVVARTVVYGGNAVVYRTAYDARGRKVVEFHGQGTQPGGMQGGIAKQFYYDDAGRLLETRSYYAEGMVVVSPLDGEGFPRGADMPIGGWLSAAEVFTYDGVGRLSQHRTLARANGVEGIVWRDGTQDDLRERTNLTVLVDDSRTDYTRLNGTSGYDAYGRVEVYRYTAKAIQWSTHTYTSAYEGWSAWQEKTVTGVSTNTNYKATTNTLTYDAYGRLSKQVDKTPLPNNYGTLHDRARAYSYNGEGRVMTRREGTLEGANATFTQTVDAFGARANYLFVHAGGQQQAELKEGGQIRGAHGNVYNTPQIQALNGRGNYVAGGGSVIVQQGETLQSVAQRIYGNASLWYVLADANGLSDPDGALVAGTQLSTPEVTVNRNDAGTFKPYDPAAAIGPTSPGLPHITPPPSQSCNALATILIVIVVIVVTIYTAGAAAGAMGATGTVTGGTAAAGATAGTVGAAATGTAVTGAVTTGVVASTSVGAIGGAVLGGGAIAGSIGVAGIAGAAFIGGVAGSIAGQVVGKALGVRDSFSLREAFAGGLTSVASAGVAGMLGSTSVAARLQPFGDAGRAAVSSVLNGVSSYAANRIAGIDASFSWKSIAANAVTAAIGAKAAPALAGKLGITSEFGNDVTSGLVGGVVGLHTRRAFGLGDAVDYGGIVADAFGNALGNSAVRGIEAARERRALGIDRRQQAELAGLTPAERSVYLANLGNGIGHDESLSLAQPVYVDSLDDAGGLLDLDYAIASTGGFEELAAMGLLGASTDFASAYGTEIAALAEHASDLREIASAFQDPERRLLLAQDWMENGDNSVWGQIRSELPGSSVGRWIARLFGAEGADWSPAEIASISAGLHEKADLAEGFAADLTTRAAAGNLLPTEIAFLTGRMDGITAAQREQVYGGMRSLMLINHKQYESLIEGNSLLGQAVGTAKNLNPAYAGFAVLDAVANSSVTAFAAYSKLDRIYSGIRDLKLGGIANPFANSGFRGLFAQGMEQAMRIERSLKGMASALAIKLLQRIPGADKLPLKSWESKINVWQGEEGEIAFDLLTRPLADAGGKGLFREVTDRFKIGRTGIDRAIFLNDNSPVFFEIKTSRNGWGKITGDQAKGATFFVNDRLKKIADLPTHPHSAEARKLLASLKVNGVVGYGVVGKDVYSPPSKMQFEVRLWDRRVNWMNATRLKRP